MQDDLVVMAAELARRERGRPKQVSLRRSVSTAYYAVFHASASMCADELVGWSQPWEAFSPIYRALDHQAARRLFETDRTGATFGQDVAEIGRTFLILQKARHIADYSPEPFPFGRQETLEFIDQAHRATERIKSLPRQTRLLLAASLVTKKR